MRSGGKATDFGVLRIANKRPSLVVALNTAAPLNPPLTAVALLGRKQTARHAEQFGLETT